MPDPISIPIGGTLWQKFALSGLTGGAAVDYNGTFEWTDEISFDNPISGASFTGEAGDWDLKSPGGVTVCNGSGGAWPWECTWGALGGGLTGALVFTRVVDPPVSVEIEGAADGGASIQAGVVTALTGSNNDLGFLAVPYGPFGNIISVAYVNPGTNNAALSVSVSDQAIVVNLATNGSAVITSTAAQVKAALEASTLAAGLITVSNAPSNDGTGVVTAMAALFLEGGSGDGPPLPPVTITI